MAVLPPIKRFIQDDYQGVSTIGQFTGKFFYTINLFLNAVYSGFANGLTLNANTIGMVTSPMMVTSSSSGVGTTTINWKYPQTVPQGVNVLSCTVNGVAASFPILSWSYNAGIISITLQFTTITAGAVVTDTAKTYQLGFWATGG